MKKIYVQRSSKLFSVLLFLLVLFGHHQSNLVVFLILLSFQNEISDKFPIKKDRHKWQGGFKFAEGAQPAMVDTLHEIDGYLFNSSTGNKIVQARMDGFTFNKLKPYTRWEEFSAEALSLWKLYIKIARPEMITRLALRYINRIEIPLPMNEFNEYVLTYPEVGPNIPKGISDYLFRLVIPNMNAGSNAVITQSIDKSRPLTERLPLIFDIDVFKNVKLSPQHDIMEIMNELRNFKNQIFLNSLTDKTKELFK